MIDWIVRLYDRLFRPVVDEADIIHAYVIAGAVYGDACTYPGGFAELGGKNARVVWAQLEKEYAARGYRTVPIRDLIQLGGYGTSLKHLVHVKRGPSEQALLWEPSTDGPTPYGSVLDDLAAIGTTPRCTKCQFVLKNNEVLHCSWCLKPLLKACLTGEPFSLNIVRMLEFEGPGKSL